MPTRMRADAVPHAPAPGGAETALPPCSPAPISLQERRPRALKHGDAFAVYDHNGDVISGPGSPEGVFHRGTRHLSHYALTVEGARPMLLSSTLRDDRVVLICDLANPDLFGLDKQLTLEHDLIHLRRSRFLWNAAAYERLVVRNFDEEPHSFSVEIAFGADFADMFEVRGAPREQRGIHQTPQVRPDRVTLSYMGLDGELRRTLLVFDPAPDRLEGDRATFRLELAPKAARTLSISIDCTPDTGSGPPRPTFFSALREARRSLKTSATRAASIATSNDIFNEAAARSISDLHMLITETPEGPYPYAGIPWFSAVFGRDALITALETLWLDPAIARGVLGYLAASQATTFDADADAEPGKILHEARDGEMPALGEVPFRRYYGSVDSTPLFVMVAGAYLNRTGDTETLRRLWPNIEAALGWIERHGDQDGDGFVEYSRRSAQGLINQGWKDSSDSVFHADGALARGPIALVEVQAYVYGAWRAAADIARRLGREAKAAGYDGRAQTLRIRFDESFFDEALGGYVAALDGDKRPCRVRTSNAGHALLTGLAYPERAAAIARTLMSTASFCGWGVRTVAASEARYNPMSYHNGSVWPHDNALIAAGFALYGFRRQAARIFEGLFAASTYVDLRRLPELFCGFPRRYAEGPTFYPVACSPQAWAAAAPLFMLQACLGLGFDPDKLYITFDEPALPAFIEKVVLKNLTINGGSADVALRRSGPYVVVDVLDRRGRVRVLTTT